MNLDSVTAELRPRSPWEAADFGVRMIRRDAGAIYKIWFALTLPMLVLALLGAAYTPYPTLALFLYWWLEPVADGPILHVIAQRLFGEEADVKAALRRTPALARRNWIFLLSPYRLHFARSIAMPLTQLEGASGATRRSRAKVLNPLIFGYGMAVTAAYEHLVLALYFGIVLIGFAFIPPEYQGTLGFEWIGNFFSEERTPQVLGMLLFYVAQTALEPWFVGAGFGLYINSRTQLEAWDLEVAFRRMVQRRARRAAAAAVVLAACALPLLSGSGTVRAQPDETIEDPGFAGFWADAEVRPALDAVMNGDELRATSELETWRPKARPEDTNELEEGSAPLFGWLGRLLSFGFEIMLWLLVGALAWVLYATRAQWWPSGWQQEAPSPPQRVVLAGGEITAETLPDDVGAAALALWRAGQVREALSLLYRASVFAAVHQYGVRLPESATEGACIAAVAAGARGRDERASRQAAFFERVATAWVWCAYGAAAPEGEVVEALCGEWPRHYASQAEP